MVFYCFCRSFSFIFLKIFLVCFSFPLPFPFAIFYFIFPFFIKTMFLMQYFFISFRYFIIISFSTSSFLVLLLLHQLPILNNFISFNYNKLPISASKLSKSSISFYFFSFLLKVFTSTSSS